MTITQDYPIVNFDCFLNPVQRFKNSGYLIGNWLYVGHTDSRCLSTSIFNCFGYKAIPVNFKKWVDATQVAEMLSEQYKDYFALWYDYPQADVPLLTQYTIPNGQALHSTIQNFSGQVISYDEFIDVYTRFSN